MILPSTEKFEQALNEMDQEKLHAILETAAQEIKEQDSKIKKETDDDFLVIFDPELL